MDVVTICSDFGTQEDKIYHCFTSESEPPQPAYSLHST